MTSSCLVSSCALVGASPPPQALTGSVMTSVTVAAAHEPEVHAAPPVRAPGVGRGVVGGPAVRS